MNHGRTIVVALGVCVALVAASFFFSGRPPSAWRVVLRPDGGAVVQVSERAGATVLKTVGWRGEALGEARVDETLISAAFDAAGERLLVAAWRSGQARLLLLKPAGPQNWVVEKTLATQKLPIRFAVDDGHRYLFLQNVDARQAQWQVLDPATGAQAVLAPRMVKFATYPVVRPGLAFYIEPAAPEADQVVALGAPPPPEVAAFVKAHGLDHIACTAALRCLGRHTVGRGDSGGPVAQLFFLAGGQSCRIKGEWASAEELQLSALGDRFIFVQRGGDGAQDVLVQGEAAGVAGATHAGGDNLCAFVIKPRALGPAG